MTTGHPFQDPSGGGVPPLPLGGDPPRVAEGGASGRSVKCNSSLAQPSKSKRRGMAPPSRHLSIVHQTVGTVGAGFIHQQRQCPNNKISNKTTNAGGSGSGCSSVSMGPEALLRFSAKTNKQTKKNLIPLFRKSTGSQAEVILVAPHWPKRPWFPDIVQLSLGKVWRIPLGSDLLT